MRMVYYDYLIVFLADRSESAEIEVDEQTKRIRNLELATTSGFMERNPGATEFHVDLEELASHTSHSLNSELVNASRKL